MSTAEDGRSFDDLLDTALTTAVHRTGASAGAVYLLDADEQVLVLTVLCGMPLEIVGPWWRVPKAAPLPVTDAVREQRLVWVGGQEEMARLYPRTAAALPYRFAVAATPLLVGRGCAGVLLLWWPSSHPPDITNRERTHIASHARRVARLLDDTAHPIELPEQPRSIPVHPGPLRSEQRLLAAADFAERLPGGALSLDLEGRITFLTAGAARLLGCRAEQLLGTLPWQSLPWLDDPVHEDRYRTAVISREPVSFTALRPPDCLLDFQLYPDASGISVRITPGRPGRQQPTQELEERSAQKKAPSTPVGRLYQMMHLAAALTEAVGVQDVVDLVADQILPAFGAQGLVLSAADAGRLKITGFRGYDPQTITRLDGLPLTTDLTPAGQVLTSGLPSFFSDPQEMARLYPQAPQISDKQAWAFLPLVISGRPVGCCIVSYDHPHRFTADERAVLTSLAGLVAQALDRARLYDAKHDLAHALQQALLPRTIPTFTGLDVAARYLPAAHGMEIGGDFYDLIRLTDTTVAAVIGDVQGHNVTAAALMGQVRTAVHSHATAGAPPDEVLSGTNRVLADLEPDLLVSCLYAHLDIADRRLEIASAGHPPPLLLRHHVADVLDVPPGPLLGIDADVPYPVTRLTLPTEALLVLYTDGLVETPGADPDESTLGLVQHLAQADDVNLDHLIERLVHHNWPTGQHTDDIALLLLRLRGASSPNGAEATVM